MKAIFKASFSLVIAVALLFIAIAMIMAHNTSALMVSEAERTVRSVVRATTGKVDQLMIGVETAVANSVWNIHEHIADPDYMYRITRELVRNNKYIVGSAVAFEPNHFKSKGHFFAPYTCDPGDGNLKSFQLGTFGGNGVAANDYFTQDWYVNARNSGKSVWSEPYFDAGGAKILMSTYSMPIKDAAGKVIAVFTADLSLRQLTEHIASICPYPKSYAVMTSAKGAPLVNPPANRNARGDAGTIAISDNADNGWTIKVVCPVETILEGARKLIYRIVLFSLLGLGLIFVLAWFYSSRLQRASALRERMESELYAAKTIQSGYLPMAFPDRVSAVLRAAREVGGDLYDFSKAGDTLYFIVGDASGKGVPASLFSFMTGTIFRMACQMRLNPAEILGRINSVLCNGNETCMFVTAFAGAINLKTGQFDYGCAGHNPPVIVSPDGEAAFLRVKRGPPTGAVRGTYYQLQSVTLPPGSKVIVYTDGVTEAERANHDQFGEERLLACAKESAKAEARETTQRVMNAVDAFVAGAPQSDDITVMSIGC